MLTEAEIEKLLEVYIANAEEDVDEEKCLNLINWAQHARVDCLLIDMVLADKINVSKVLGESEVMFSNTSDFSQKLGLTKELDEYLNQKFLSDI